MRTHSPTDGRTDTRTDMSAYRVALQFYWTRLEIAHCSETHMKLFLSNCGSIRPNHAFQLPTLEDQISSPWAYDFVCIIARLSVEIFFKH